MDLRLGLVILVLYCANTVTPAKLPLIKPGNQCSLHCTESNNLRYQPGKTYIYDYVGKTQISSAQGNDGSIEVHAKAHVSVIDNCELSLQLKNVALKGLEIESEAKKELEEHPIGFSYQDGSVASVCPSTQDLTWSVNVKKAIISALQVSSTPKSGKTVVTEIDILGHCETQYESLAIPSSSNVFRSIRKTKNLRNCHHRQANLFSLFPTKYSSESSGIQNIPILANEHECSIEVSKESIVSKVNCKDSATLLPLSWTRSTSSGFDSLLSLTLEATVSTTSTQPIDSSNRQQLTFKHTLKEPLISSKSNVNQVTALLKDLCSSVENEVGSNVPTQFAELVYQLRNLSPLSTSKLWSSVSKGQICPSTSKLTDLFTDALIMDGSEGSLKVIVELINEGSTSSLTINYWLTLLAFTGSPTEGSIKSLLPLIKNKSLPRQSVLGVSALVHNYCSSPDVDCTSSPIVNEVTRTLASRLAYKCSVTSGNEDDTIVTLKGLANIAPYLSNGEVRSILECSKNSNSLFVRVTATETLQPFACLDSVALTMMDLFTSTEYDAELRIAAYKNVFACPSASKVEAILLTLENEPSVQVGSYVVSHLSNIQESSDPLKSEQKLYLTGIKIPLKSFPQDIRKFSRYYELSQHLSKLNLGAVVESDVIFDGSYVPRSIKANLSLPIFGSSLNLAEIGFRQKGLENSLENLFGPSGSLRGKNWKEILESLASLLLNGNDRYAIEANRYRLTRRSVQWPFKPVKLESLVKKAAITPSPVEGSMYLKVDGKTIVYLSLADIKKDSVGSLFDSKLENIIKSAKYDRAFSFMVIDSVHQFPGINGFPIKIDINSTAVVGYKQTDKTIYPSFASELSVKVGFDSRTSKPGLKWVTKVNSAPALSAEVEYKKSIPVKLTLSLPKETLTLFHYKSDLISIATDNSEKFIQSELTRSHEGCTQSFTKPFGVELCGELFAPKPLFTLASPLIPFNGPINVDISLRKTDTTMKGWTFIFQIPNEDETTDQVYSVGFLTPESTINREYRASLGLSNRLSNDKMLKNVRLTLVYPNQLIDASIGGEIGGGVIHAHGEVSVNSNKYYSARVNLGSLNSGRDLVFHGEAFVSLDRILDSPVHLKGKLTVKNDLSLIFNLKPENGAAYIDGSINSDRLDISGDLRSISFRLLNLVSREKSNLRNNFNLSYRKGNSNKEEKISLTSSIKSSSLGSVDKYVTRVEGSSSLWPKNSFMVTLESSYSPWELIENDLTIETGYKSSSRGYSSKSKVTQISRFSGLTGDYSDVSARNTLIIDVAGFYYKANLISGGQLSSPSKKGKIDFTGGDRSATDKHKILINFGLQNEPLLRFSSSALIKMGPISINYADSLAEKSQGKYIGSSELMVSDSTFWAIGYNYTQGNDNKYKMSRDFDFSVKLPRFNVDFNQKGSFETNKDEMKLTTIASNRFNKLWSMDGKISQTSQSSAKIDLFSLGSMEANVLPTGTNKLANLKLSYKGYFETIKLAFSPSSATIDSELRSGSSLIYQISGQQRSINKWSVNLVTSPVTVIAAMNPENGKLDVKLSKQKGHHVTTFLNDRSTFSLTSDTRVGSKPVLTIKTDYQRSGSVALEVTTNPFEIHSEVNFKLADRLEFESTFNAKRYSKVFTIEGSIVKRDVKLTLQGRGLFTVKVNLESLENLKLDVDINKSGTTGITITNKPELKAFSFNGNYPISKWEQSTLIQYTPEAVTIFSSTRRSAHRYLFINGRISDETNLIDVKFGDKDALYGEWSSVKGKGSLKLNYGQYAFDHDSSLSLESNKLLITSTTTKASKPLVKINLDSDRLSSLDLTVSLLADHSLSLSLGSNSRAFDGEAKLTSQSYSFDHSTKVNYAYAVEGFDLKSVTNSKGSDLLTVKMQSARRAPLTLEVYSDPVTGTIQIETSANNDQRFTMKMMKPFAIETEINYKSLSEQLTVFGLIKKTSSGEQLFEIDAKIQPKGQSIVSVDYKTLKGRISYSHWSSIDLTIDNGLGFNHQTTIDMDSQTSAIDVKSSTSQSGSVTLRIDGHFDVNERINVKVLKAPWDGSIELDLDKLMLTTSLTNQVESLVHSTRAEITQDTFTLTSDTTRSSVNLFSFDCQLSLVSKSQVKVSSSSWSSTATYSTIKSSHNLDFSLNRPSISSEYTAKVTYDTRLSSLKLLSNIEREGLKSKIETDISGSSKSWFKYSSSTKGRIDWEISPFGSSKIAKVSVDWKPIKFVHNSEIKLDQNGFKIKSTSSKSSSSLYTFDCTIGQLNGQSPGIEINLVKGASSYRHISSYTWNRESFSLLSKSIVDRVSLWDLKGSFPLNSEQTLTTLDLDSPKVSGKVTFDPNDRSVKVDVSLKQSKRRIVLKTIYGPQIADSFNFDLAWDADRDSNAHLIISRDGQSNDSSRKDSLTIEYGSQIKASLTSKLGFDITSGPHDISISVSLPNTPRRSMSYHHEMNSKKIECYLRWYEDELLVHQITHEMTMGSGSMTMDFATKSRKPVYNGLHLSFKHSQNAFSSITSELKIQPTSGSPYSIKLNTESASSRNEKSFIGKIWIKTPIASYRQQGLTINLSWNPHGSQSKVNLKATRESGDSASLAINYSLKSFGGSFSLSLDGPLTGSYDGSIVKGQFDNRSNKKSISLESEIVTVGNFNFIINEQSGKLEGQITLSSPTTSRYTASFKTDLQRLTGTTHEISLTQNNIELFASELSLDYVKLLHGKFRVTSKGSDLLRFEIDRYHVTSEERKYVAHYTGPRGPLKVNLNLLATSDRSQIELQVCPANQCYNLMALDVTNEWGRESKITYRNGVHSRTYLASYALKSSPDQLTASGLINLNGVPFGGELSKTKTTSIGKIILSQRVIETRIKSSATKHVIDFLADAKREPSAKVTLEADLIDRSVPSKDIINVEYKLRFGSSSIYRPISVAFSLRKDKNDDKRPFDSKIVLDLGKSESQSLIIEGYLENVNGNANNRSVGLIVYQPGSSSKVNFSFKGHYGSTAGQLSTGITWSWMDRFVQRKGINLFTINYDTKEIRYIAHGGFNDISSRVRYSSDSKSVDLVGEITVNGIAKKGQLTGSLEGNCGLLKAFTGNNLQRKIEACLEPYKLIRISSQQFNSDSSPLTDLSLMLTQRNGKVLKASLILDPDYSQKLKSISWPAFNLQKPQWKGLPSAMIVNEQIFLDLYQPISESVTVETVEFIDEMDQHTAPLRMIFYNYMPTLSFNMPTIDLSSVVDGLSNWTDEIASTLANQVKSVCKYKSLCYRMAYAFDRYGFDGLTAIASDSWKNYKSSISRSSNEMINTVYQSAQSMYKFLSPYPKYYISLVDKHLRSLAKWPCRLSKSITSKADRAFAGLSRKMLSNPDMRSLFNLISSLYREITSELGKFEVRSAFSLSTSHYRHFLSPKVWGASARYTTWNPDKGIYEVELVSPVDIETAKSSLRSSQQSASDLNDSLNGLKASLWSEITPPFKSTAFLLGGQHFVTFDGRSYDFSNTDCSYLLARDFVNGNFSVIVKYNGGNKKSFLITLGSDNVIEINPSEKRVKLGRNIVELPVIQDSLTILRNHRSIVLEDQANGLTFKCFLGRDLCSLTLSGWYFGRTKGLFGTYDYEPSNDYLLPNGRLAANSNELASGWEIEGSCANPSGKPIRQEEIRRSSKAYRLCDKIFSSPESPLADGFSFVSPNFYFSMCLRHMAATKGQDRPEKALCNIAGAYIESVKANGLELSMPAECLTCEAGQEFGSRSFIAPTTRSSKADIVFVIEERPCNGKLINDLPNLARNMHKELEESGLNDPKFGVIGFGGSSVDSRQAHGHTARGELLFQHQDIVMAVKRMELAPVDSYDANYTDGLSAIVLASQYPFRKAASKNIILLTCKPCDEQKSRFDYNDIQHLLLSEGITLHVVSNQRFNVKHVTSKTRDILGIDSRSVQRATDIRSTEISDEQLYLRKLITLPKDVCISLATLSNGSFYPNPLATSLDHRLEKLWYLGLARRLASSANPNQCQHCDCVLDNDLLHSKILCRPCRPLKPIY